MSLCDQDLLNVSVRAAMAFGPRCFRCMLEMLSGPVALEFFSDLMVSATSSVVNGGGVFSSFIFLRFLRVRLFCCVVGLWLIFE